MIPTIERNPFSSLQSQLSPIPQQRISINQGAEQRDRIQSSNKSKPSCCKRIWDAVVGFFKNILTCCGLCKCFGNQSQTPNPTDRSNPMTLSNHPNPPILPVQTNQPNPTNQPVQPVQINQPNPPSPTNQTVQPVQINQPNPTVGPRSHIPTSLPYGHIRVENTDIYIHVGNLLDQPVDAIVIPAVPTLDPAHGGQLAQAVYNAAGPAEISQHISQFLSSGASQGSAVPMELSRGHVVATPAGNLRQRGIQGIMHAVLPTNRGDETERATQLRGVYTRSLELADQNRATSIAFPVLGVRRRGELHFTNVPGLPGRVRIMIIALNSIAGYCVAHRTSTIRTVHLVLGGTDRLQDAFDAAARVPSATSPNTTFRQVTV